MIVILDASTLINLVNGEVLAAILSIPGAAFQMSAAVRTESKSIAEAIDAAVARRASWPGRRLADFRQRVS